MKYIIVVDKQSSSNPSSDKREYTIDIEELRTFRGVSDTLKVTPDMAYVIRRLTLSEYGVLSILDEPKQENIKDLNITLFEGDNYVYILNQEGNKISASYIIKSGFTDTYPTKSEMNSAINQSASSVEISVSQKLEDYSTTEETKSLIQATSDTINLELKKKVNDEDLTGANITLRINNDKSSATINADKISLEGKEINLTGDNINIKSNNFNVDKNGNLSCSNANITGGRLNLSNATYDAPKFITSGNGLNGFNGDNIIYADGMRVRVGSTTYINLSLGKIGNNPSGSLVVSSPSSDTYVNAEGIITPTLQQTSLESIKKNISHYNENALETILNSDIYSYNLKTEKDTDKKHIGFVIGDKYKTPKEVMNNEGTAIELYSAIGILWKGMQEQQKKIEELENKLKEVTNG